MAISKIKIGDTIHDIEAVKIGTENIGSTTRPVYIKSGTPTAISKVAVGYGGTGATTAAGARANLDVYSKAETDATYATKSDLESLDLSQQYAVTYTELKQLRALSALIPGASYRITDYTAILSDAVEAGRAQHIFDIIVQAVSNNALSEIARADHHYVDARTYTLDDSVILGSGLLKANSVTRYYDVYEDFVGSAINNAGPAQYKEDDVFVAYDYKANNEGHVVPVLYKTDTTEEPDPDYGDEFYYVGVEEIDGVEYDKWRKIAESYEDGPFWTSIGKIYTYTNRVVNITQPTTYTFKAEVIGDNGLLKEGAVEVIAREGIDAELVGTSYNGFNFTDTDEVVAYGFEKNNEGVLIPVLYGYYQEFGIDVQQPYFYVGRATVNGVEYDKWRYITDIFTWESDAQLYYHTNIIIEEVPVDVVPEPYFANANLAAWELKYCLDNDTSRFIWANNSTGKGVIYYMKDEFNNECPYDFKNILFVRKVDANGAYAPDSGVDRSCYTFGGTQCDRSLPQEGLYTYNNNSIAPMFYEDEGRYALPNSVFLSEGLQGASYGNRLGVNCNYNTFGGECHNNILAANCADNIFGQYCSSNTLGSDCCENIFGIWCYDNMLYNYCQTNIFAESGCSNILESYCESNIFGFDCNSNHLGVYCYGNTFGEDCYYNTLGTSCGNNSFTTSTYNNIFEHDVYGIEILAVSNRVYIETGCRFIYLDVESGNTIQNIRICQGVSGTSEAEPRYLDCPGDALAPITYRAHGSRKIILD